MHAYTLEVVVGEVTYRVDDPKPGNGLRATVSVMVEETHDGKGLSRILHRDRINLDRARERETFAERAGTTAADLNEVRDRVLEFLVPASPLGEEPPEEADPAVRAEALALLAAPDLLTQLGAAIRALGYAGDVAQPLLIYLVFVSRLLARPMNLVVGGPSAAGKSFVVALVARFFPPIATYALTGMSERLLAYTDADLRHRTLIIGEASALHHDGIGASLLRSLAWEGHIIYETVESTPAGLKPRRIEREGPTGFVTTTTKHVEAELETRVLTIQVPDDQDATQEIIKVTAERASGRRPDEPDLRPWHEAQRILAEEGTHEVTVPFAATLGEYYPTDHVRARRDFTQLLEFIRASALLYQRQRERDEFGRIIASEGDYRIVYDLAAPVFGAVAAQGVTPAVRGTVQKVAQLTTGPEGGTISLNQLATALNLDKSSVSRRVRPALRGGFLINDELGRGKPYKLRVGDPLPQERAALPTPEQVFGPPHANTATPQHLGQEPPHDAETACCTAGAQTGQLANGAGNGVAGVDQVLHGPLQQGFPRADAEIHHAEDGCCTVASEGRVPFVGAEPEDLAAAPEEAWFAPEPDNMTYDDAAAEMPLASEGDPWVDSTWEGL
jgi:hypothetical protein